MKKHIILLILLALIVRIPFFIMVLQNPTTAYTSHDSVGYNLIATNLLHNHSYSMYLSNPEIKDPVRTPGYPLFLALMYGVFLEKTVFVVAAQLLMDVIMVLILLFFGKVLFNEKVGMIAALLYTFNMHQALFATQILAETLFTIFLLLGVLFFLLYLKNKREGIVLISGFSLGISIFIRPIALVFPVLPLIFLIYKKVHGKIISVFLISIILLPFLWSVRNALVFKRFFYTKIHSVNLVIYNAPSIVADIENVSRNQAKDTFLKYEKEKYGLSDYDIEHFDDNPALCNRLAADAIKLVISHPVSFLKNQMIGILHTFIPVNIGFTAAVLQGKGSVIKLRPIYRESLQLILKAKVLAASKLFVRQRIEKIDFSIWIFICAVIIYQFAMYYMVVKGIGRYHFNIVTLFVLISIAFFLIIPGEVGEARFRVPVEPLIALLAALGF